MRLFKDFYENKTRQAIKQLTIIDNILENAGFKTEKYLGQSFRDPYIYVYNPSNNTSFDGIRIYKIGDKIAYRVQRESKTHPFGEAYSLDVELMFDDLMEDGDHKPEEIGKKIVKMIVENIHNFFKESSEAENDNETSSLLGKDDGMGSISLFNPLGGDIDSLSRNLNSK